MQEKVERWLNNWVSKPTSWTIFGLWIAVKYTWIGVAWCMTWVHEQWTAWRSKSEPHVDSVPVPDAPAMRRKRQAA